MSDETMVPFDFPKDSPHIIKVIGVGGGGGNAVNHMYKEGIHDVTKDWEPETVRPRHVLLLKKASKTSRIC